ncbi:hypothetical protein L6164_014681 [Bauhinia variegata]|uniref:Uncharacterized protein n=1 Tax=Bauhinia variegata TaxID=167791 RepID=A0ACB9NIV3_BAUVA|nr:hypothetical protein L6164_014681 [Bauhinia variegata]
MGPTPIWVLFIVILLLFSMATSEEEVVKEALVRFMEKLAPGNGNAQRWGWKLASDPCTDGWTGVRCDGDSKFVRQIILHGFNFTGTLDASSLCQTGSLQVLDLKVNNLQGLIGEDIGNCKSLTHLYLSGNKFSGDLPVSLGELKNLKRLDVSDNRLAGQLPSMSHITGLVSFLAQDNMFSGEIPSFEFSNLEEFNVSNNKLIGPIPDAMIKFHADSFSGNPNLCGTPLGNACPPSLPLIHKEKRGSISESIAIYSGYVILGVLVFLFFTFQIIKRFRTKEKAVDIEKKEKERETSSDKPSEASIEDKESIGLRSEYSVTSLESGMPTLTLLVLSSPMGKSLRFEDLLRAPAELVGRGMHGSLYKVMLDNGLIVAVKRIKDWGISRHDFERRMHKVDQVKHPYVLPPVAYYCSQQEKLLVYEYQQNGSLFKMLSGSQNGQRFDWGSRLNVAANIAEALAYMHEELCEAGIAHGNLKSSNILFDKNMDPCVSEYGLMVVENQDPSSLPHSKGLKNGNSTGALAYSTFMVDIYAFGVILLELLTGKVVQNNGFDLAKWVNSVVREEWTVEVFDKSLISEGASEERMVSLLQIALKCINPSPSDRPSMCEVAVMTIALKEEEERSITFEP